MTNWFSKRDRPQEQRHHDAKDDAFEIERSTTPEMRAAIKLASERTVKALGGGENARYYTRYDASRISRCISTDAKHREDYFSLDVAVDLDIKSGGVLFDEILRLTGRKAVPIEAADDVVEVDPHALSAKLVDVAMASSALLAASTDAARDGKICAAEHRAMNRALAKFYATGFALVDICTGKRGRK